MKTESSHSPSPLAQFLIDEMARRGLEPGAMARALGVHPSRLESYPSSAVSLPLPSGSMVADRLR